MFHVPVIVIALAGTAECDDRATIAGELMILHQSGAGAQDVAAAARATVMPDFALSLVTRVVSAETSPDASARELAAYHFAAEIHGECHAPNDRMS